MNNPYPKTIIDEISGVEVPCDAHKHWQEGFEAGRKAEREKVILLAKSIIANEKYSSRRSNALNRLVQALEREGDED